MMNFTFSASYRLIVLTGLSLSLTGSSLFAKAPLSGNFNALNDMPIHSTVYSPDNFLQAEIKGTVKDLKNQFLQGVTIENRSTGAKAQSDSNGSFSLPASIGDELTFSLIGYDRGRVTVASSSDLSITLTEAVSDLDEVLVTGYSTQSKREITGSISSIRSEEIAGAMATSIDGAMQGRMAGVNIQNSVGVPGGGMTVRVRGVGSITAGNAPIYVVDGMVMNTTATSHTVSTNPLATIDPDDILSVEVLKDAAAASVYGAQAGNGVVLITTKQGGSGKPSFEVVYRTGVTTPIRFLDVMNTQEYLNARMEAMRHANPSWSEQRVRENVLGASQLPLDLSDEQIQQLETYDWQKEAFGNGGTNKINIAVSGGSEKNKYRISTGYEDTKGSVIASGFTRGNVNLSSENNITDRLVLSSRVNLFTTNQTGPLGSLGTSTQFSAPGYAAPLLLPFVPIYLENGELNVNHAGFPGTFKRNIIHSSLFNEHIEKSSGIIGNFSASFKIADYLDYKGVVGVDYRDANSRNYYDPRTTDGYNVKGSLQEYTENPVTFTTSHTINFKPELGEGHSLNALLGVEYYSYQRQSSYTRGEGFPTFEFKQMQSAALITDATGSWTGFKRLGSFLQTNYNYQNRFMGSLIMRYDGSSRFGRNNMFGFFPAISAGWDLAQEEFLVSNDWVNQLKLRVGYGQTGNDQIGNFASRSLFGGGMTYNGESGIRSNSLGNQELRWERNVTTNIGLDYSLFNQRLFGSIEVYNRLSKDLLLSRPVAWAGGFSEIVENLGEISNKGLEIEIGGRIISKEKFNWNSSFNISFQKNIVNKLYDGLDVLPGDDGIRVGYALNTHVLPQYAGVNPATGKAIWYDESGDLTYNPSSSFTDIYAPYGLPNSLPKSFGGFNNELNYGPVTISAFLQFDYGRVLYNNMNRNLSRKGDAQFNSIKWYYENRWQYEGHQTTVPRPYNNAAERGSARGDLASTRYLEDASYIRLKNINLTYNLNGDWLSKVYAKNARISLQANNLHTWTKFTGYDPEYNSQNTGLLPVMRSYFINLQLDF